MSFALPLLSVRDLRESLVAGYGNATATVRLLDGVSLSIHAGELILVHGNVASGAGSLCSALAAPRRGVAGERIVARGVAVRRATITPAAREAIVAGWTSEPPIGTSAVRVVYLLRVRTPYLEQHRGGRSPSVPCSPLTDAARVAWRDWSLALRGSGSAVVLFDAGAPARTGATTGSTSGVAAGAAQRAGHSPAKHAVHETLDVARQWQLPRRTDSGSPAPATVRGLALSRGRIVSEWTVSAGARSPERRSPETSFGGHDGPASPTISSRCSTGSTVP